MADNENRLITVVLTVSDLDLAVDLYTKAFGLAMHRDDHRGADPWTSGRHAATSWTEGEVIHFALYEARDGVATSGAQIAFRVTDLDAAHEQAVLSGAQVLHGPKSQPWGRSARYLDPDDNVIELTQPAAPAGQKAPDSEP